MTNHTTHTTHTTDVSEHPRYRAASRSTLPKAADAIDDPDLFKKAVALLNEGTAVRVKQSELEYRLEAIKEELAAICEAYGTKGLRHGLNGFEYFGWSTRQTLSKEKLLALGVPAETIAAAYQESKPFLSARINPFDVE